MRRILKLELKRSFMSRGMKTVFVLSLILALCQFAGFYSISNKSEQFYQAFEVGNGDYEVGIYPNTLYESFIAGEGFSVFNTLYYFLLPLFAVLPFGISFFKDEETGYIKNICCRVKKKNYLIAKYVAVFISGAVASGMPFAFSFIISALRYPAVLPNQMALQSWVQDASMLSEFYYTHTGGYVCCYFLLTLMFGGFIATSALPVSFIAKHYLIVLFTPLALYLAQYYVLSMVHMSSYSVFMVINMCGSHFNLTVSDVCLYFVVCMLISFTVFITIGMNREKII